MGGLCFRFFGVGVLLGQSRGDDKFGFFEGEGEGEGGKAADESDLWEGVTDATSGE